MAAERGESGTPTQNRGLARAVATLLGGGQIAISSGGRATMDCVDVRDVAGAIAPALETDRSCVFNIGSGVACSFFNMATALRRSMGLDPADRLVSTDEGRPGVSFAYDISLARKDLGYAQEFALKQIMDWVSSDLPVHVSGSTG